MAESLGILAEGKFTSEAIVNGEDSTLVLALMSYGMNASGKMISMHPTSHLLLT